MRGFIEVKEDTYEDTIEHLHRLKKIACNLIKKLSELSEVYDRNYSKRYDEDEYEDEWNLRKKKEMMRYNY